jgi:hypothetical protein
MYSPLIEDFELANKTPENLRNINLKKSFHNQKVKFLDVKMSRKFIHDDT